MATPTPKPEKIILELTPKEAFALQCALESFADIGDSEFKNIVKIADRIYNRIPNTGVVWDDVAS